MFVLSNENVFNGFYYNNPGLQIKKMFFIFIFYLIYFFKI